VTLAHRRALRRQPGVYAALEAFLKFEKDPNVANTARLVLSTRPAQFREDLVAAVKAEPNHGFVVDGQGNPVLPEAFVTDFTYFRNHVIPEMTSVLRTDQCDCMSCHGKLGRTPMDLHAPDDSGILPVDQLLVNYRTLQQRIDLGDIERSKLLREPLNFQPGKEDGHQGDRRYNPDDTGYKILRRWIFNQQ